MSSCTQKLKIGVSACLAGDAVRYDGRDKTYPLVTEVLSQHFELVHICPEFMAGLGVPRPPVKLVDVAGDIKALGVDDPRLEVTDTLKGFAVAKMPDLQHLSGFVFKSRSPSCGVGSTPIWSQHEEVIFVGNGLFVAQLLRSYPRMPIVDEEVLAQEGGIAQFIAKVEAYAHGVCSR